MNSLLVLTVFFNALASSSVWCAGIKVDVPQVLRVPSPMWLNCSVTQLGVNESLIHIKWFKKNELFYSYSPHETVVKKMNILFGNGVSRLNLTKSSEGNAYIEQTDMNTTGCYTCEVTFNDGTAVRSNKAKATTSGLYLPIDYEPPELVYLRNDEKSYINVYDEGDEIKLNCISDKSNPAPLLTIYVFDQNVTSQLLNKSVKVHQSRQYMDDQIYSYLLYESELNGSLIAKPEYVKNGIINITCVLTIDVTHTYKVEVESDDIKLRVLKKRIQIYEKPSVRRHKLIFYGTVGVLVGALLIWYMCMASNSTEKDTLPGDNVSNISAYYEYVKPSILYAKSNQPEITKEQINISADLKTEEDFNKEAVSQPPPTD